VLEGFDHAPRGVILFRQLDRGIRQRASALIAASDTAGHVREPGPQLSGLIAGVLRCQLVPSPAPLFNQASQVLGDRRILPAERPVTGTSVRPRAFLTDP